MSNYTKSTNFASKDSLASGNPLKIVKGTEIDTEFNNIATAIATKADLVSPAFTTPDLGTPSAGTLTNCTFPTLNQNTTGSAGSLATANWTVVESGGVLYFKYGGVNKMKLDSSGNITVVGNVTAYGTV